MSRRSNSAAPPAAKPEATEKKRAPLRGVRDPRQRFSRDAAMVWRRTPKGDPSGVQPGDDVDKESVGPRRLRQLWEAGWIELKDWSRSPIHDPRVGLVLCPKTKRFVRPAAAVGE